jgi:hypothetical protein
MDRIKIHTTDIESFRWYQQIESMTADEMISRLLRTEPENEKMRLGTLWHEIMEGKPDEITSIQRDGYTFEVTFDYEIEFPEICEIRTSKTYIIDGIEVSVTGKCDGITGNRVDDHKLTFRPNPDNYLESFQWKSYLDMFNADRFRYIIYAAKQKGKVISINDISTLEVYRYPAMVDDLVSGIRQLVNFIVGYVPQMVMQ